MPQFSDEQNQLIAEFCEVLALFAARGRVAITLGGSHAKGRGDALSDFDFRVYADVFLTEDWPQSPAWRPFRALKADWQARGFRIDDFWPRTVADVEGQLSQWEAGKIAPTPVVWSVWGYHVLTDIASQHAIYDPDGLVSGWKTRLKIYPPALKTAILREHGELVRYWKTDYHYENKVARGDALFLAGLSAKIVHSLSQMLFALNETHFPGDGWNGAFLENFAIAPRDFHGRAVAALYPPLGPQQLEIQREQLLQLIAEVEALMG